MKFLIAFIGLIVLIGIVYGLAAAHIIPVKSIASSSPAAQNFLQRMKLVPPPKPPAPPSASSQASTPTVDPLAAQKQQIAAEQAQIDQEKIALAKKATQLNRLPTPAEVGQTSPKLVEIYEAMDSDDLATLFAKEPDSAVVSALIAMDSKKSAQALTAISTTDPVRAAKITALMNLATATAPQTPQQ
jgi:flagellar motility protein MotE (MotC chaperone)